MALLALSHKVTPGIREAGEGDIPALVDLGLTFVAQTSYAAHLTPNPDAIARTMALVLQAGAIFVVETEGIVTGMIGVHCYPHPWSGELMASELFWWGGGQGLALLRAAEQWARAHGATVLQMVSPTDRVSRLYERLGYTPIETSFQKRLE